MSLLADLCLLALLDSSALLQDFAYRLFSGVIISSPLSFSGANSAAGMGMGNIWFAFDSRIEALCSGAGEAGILTPLSFDRLRARCASRMWGWPPARHHDRCFCLILC